MESARKLAKKVSGAGRRKSKTPTRAAAARAGTAAGRADRGGARCGCGDEDRVASARLLGVEGGGALREDHKQKSDAATKIAAIRKGKATA